MKRELAIFGAGGHAKMAIEVARTTGDYDEIFCVDSRPGIDRNVGVPVLVECEARLRELANRPLVHAFVAIGDNRRRAQIADRLRVVGAKITSLVSSGAWIAESAEIGPCTIVMPGSVVGADVKILEGVIVNTGATVDHDCVVGAFAHIGPGVHLSGSVQVGAHAFLGVGSACIPSCKVGEGSVLGAGSVLLEDIPPWQTWVGCPARLLRQSVVHVA